MLRSIARSAPEYVNHQIWSDTAAAAEASIAGLPPLTVSLVYRPGEAQRPLFPPDRKALYDEVDALRILHLHIDTEGGITGRRGGEGGGGGVGGSGDGKAGANKPAERCKGDVPVLLDPRLADALFSGQKGSVPTRLSLGEIRHRWVGLLEPWTRVAGGSLAKPALRPGKAPALVSIRTEQRRGHMVTVVGGVSVLGIDKRQLADELLALLGAAAGVEGTPTKEGPPRLDVMVQGLWDRAVAEHLSTAHGVPARVVENRAAGRAGMHQKKEKAATNVRKS
jgi:translation initiation factor 1 (eIF-1/SUI1)